MRKPTRKVMSMVPNHHYLDGYNDCVEETERHSADVLRLFAKVLDAHCTAESLTESGLRNEVGEYLLNAMQGNPRPTAESTARLDTSKPKPKPEWKNSKIC